MRRTSIKSPIGLGEKEKDEVVTVSRSGNENFFSRMLNKVIGISLFMLFFGFPLFFTGLTFQGLVFEKQLYFYFWILLALVAWVWRGKILGELKIKRTAFDIPIVSFWLIYAVSTAFSVDRWHSFWGFFGDPSRGLVSITALIIAYYIIISNFTKERFAWIFRALIISGSIISIWSFLGVFGLLKFFPEIILRVVPFSLLGSISGSVILLSVTSILLVVGVLKIVSYFSGWRKIISATALLIILILNLISLLALYGFVYWPAVLVGVGIFVIYIISNIVKINENWNWLPMLVFVVLFAFAFLIGNNNISRISLPFEVSLSPGTSWGVAKESLKNDFLFGSGPASYGYDFSLYRPNDFNEDAFGGLRFYQGSGIIFESLSSIGGLGTLVLIFIIVAFVGFQLYLLTREKGADNLYSLGLFVISMVIIINALLRPFDGGIFIFGSLIAILSLAVLFHEGRVVGGSINLSLKGSPKYALALGFMNFIVLIGVVASFVSIGRAFISDVYAGKAMRSNNVSDSTGLLLKSVQWFGKEGRYFTRLGQEYMVLANNEALKKDEEKNISLIRDYLNSSVAAAERGKSLMKNDVLATEVLAQVYENAAFYVSGSINLAEDNYKRAMELEPNNPTYDVKLGQIKFNAANSIEDKDEKNKMIEDAKMLFEKSIEKKSDFSAGYYNLSLAHEALGDLDKAIESMSKAFSFERNNINYVFNLGRLYQSRGGDDDNKLAEQIFKEILGVNDKELNAHFNLGLLYEKTGRKSEAIQELEKVIELLPEDAQESKAKIEELIENIKNGISNITTDVESSIDSQSNQNIDNGVGIEDQNPSDNSLPEENN